MQIGLSGLERLMTVKIWREVSNSDECNATIEGVREWYESGSYTVFALDDGSRRLLRTETIFEFKESRE